MIGGRTLWAIRSRFGALGRASRSTGACACDGATAAASARRRPTTRRGKERLRVDHRRENSCILFMSLSPWDQDGIRYTYMGERRGQEVTGRARGRPRTEAAAQDAARTDRLPSLNEP